MATDPQRDPALKDFRAMAKPWRILHARRRLFAGIIVGVVIGLLLPSSWRPSSRLLIGWDSAIAVYLVQVFVLMAKADLGHIRRLAQIEDEGRFAILIIIAIAAFASLLAIFFELGEGRRSTFELTLAILTVALSWCVVQFTFALHYAHDYYRGKTPGGLEFPGDDKPDYWDFLYFSLVVGMTAQVSDVNIRSKVIRRTAAAHGFVAFVFNTTLLALMVNIAATAISS
jgi:uncharacterized membrane protein